ncbi:MAG: HD domain-containing protein [Fimbriiglobus sp.]
MRTRYGWDHEQKLQDNFIVGCKVEYAKIITSLRILRSLSIVLDWIIFVSCRESTMPQESFTQTKVWQRTLADRGKKDVHTGLRARLRVCFEKFRSSAEALANQIPVDLPFFTVHDVTHLDALWQMVDIVAGDDYPLTPTEAFVLGGAILVHDLALSQTAYQDQLPELKSEPIWKDTIASILRSKIGRTPTTSEIQNPDTESENLAVGILLRELHAKQAEALPKKKFNSSGTDYSLIDDADLRTSFADAIGKVAFSHHWPLDDVRDPSLLHQSVAGGPGWLPAEWTLDLVKLACLLRAADAAHCDNRRAPGFLNAIIRPSGLSQQHWTFQSKLGVPRTDASANRIRYRSLSPFLLEDSEAWWIGFDWLKMVDRELNSIDALLAETSRHRFVARGVFNIDSPSRLMTDLRTEGWVPVDAEIRIRDIPALVKTLGGTQLYGDRPEVPLRELIQNAADAIRARRKLQSKPEHGQIIVRSGHDIREKLDWIEVEDDGLGMSKTTLCGTLLDFGSAFWGTQKMRQELPGLEAMGMEATGKFGIGFFSVFMWGEKVQVITRRYDVGYADTLVLEFNRGVQRRPLLRKATRDEQESLCGGGTKVRVWCSDTNTVLNLRRRQRQAGDSESFCTWRELCEWLAPALDVNLDVEIGGSRENSIRANDWLTIGMDRIMLRMNIKNRVEYYNMLILQSSALQLSTQLLRVVYDERGLPIARGTVWMTEGSPYNNSCAVVGGLRTDGAANFAGIRFAQAETAARHTASLGFQREGWVAWAQEQMDLNEAVEWPLEFRALAANRLAPLLDPGKLPIGLTKDGWVTIAQFGDLIRQHATFQCIGVAPFWAAAEVLIQHQDVPTLVVYGQYLLNQIDGRGFSLFDRIAEMAKHQWGEECIVSDSNTGGKYIQVQGEFVSTHLTTFSRASFIR